MYIPPSSTERILDDQQESKTKLPRTENFACNYSPLEDPIAHKVDFQHGRISNPYEIISVIPRHCHREGSKMRRADTWGTVGGHISVLPGRSPKCPEVRVRNFNETKSDDFQIS